MSTTPPADQPEPLKPWHEFYAPGMTIIPLPDLLTTDASGIEGEGVYAKCAIPFPFTLGPVLGPLCPEPYDSRTCVVYDDQHCLEPTDEGVPVHRMNHSCDPNCEIDYIDEDGFAYALVVNSLRPIAPGEELTIDYAPESWENNPYADESGLPVCRCGSPKCRGWIMSADVLVLRPNPPSKP